MNQQQDDEVQRAEKANAYLNSLPSAEQLKKWEDQQKRKQLKARDKKDEKNAGIPNPNAMENYYDQYGDPLEDVEIPLWAVALHLAHKAEPGMRVFRDFGVHRYSQPARTTKKKQTNRDRKIKELEVGGYTVEDRVIYDNLGNSWELVINGKVRLSDGTIVNANVFMSEHGTLRD